MYCKSLLFLHLFGDSAITLIFAKGWGSLAFSKMMVKKVAKNGWEMNSVSYLGKRGSWRHNASAYLGQKGELRRYEPLRLTYSLEFSISQCYVWEMTYHHTKKRVLKIWKIYRHSYWVVDKLEFLCSKNIAPIIGFPVTRWNTSSTWEQKTVSQ